MNISVNVSVCFSCCLLDHSCFSHRLNDDMNHTMPCYDDSLFALDSVVNFFTIIFLSLLFFILFSTQIYSHEVMKREHVEGYTGLAS